MATNVPLACSLTGAELAARGREVAGLFERATRVRELRDGYALEFAGGDEMAREVLDFVLAERACCPFFSFTLRSHAPHSVIWLEVRGRGEAKEIVRAALPERVGLEV